VVDGRPLRDLRGWDWGVRFAKAGLQRVELLGPVERDDFVHFLDEAYRRLSGAPIDTASVRQERPTNIRYGAVGLRGEEGEGAGSRIATATLGYNLVEEVEGVGWLHEQLKDNQQLHMLEAESIVRSLSVAMHGDQAFMIPLLKLKRFDQYTTTHAMNVSVLAMSLAEFIGLSPNEVKTFGIAGLLHDLGKITVPDEILNKPGKLTDSERQVMNRHTIEGARIILETEDQLDLAATVAYEHHIKLNGGGYPTLSYPRSCHQASDMVHVCDVFDALRTNRPYREAWSTERVLSYVEEGSGTEFDADLARAFVQMIRTWEGRVLYMDDPKDAVKPPVDPAAAAAAAAAGADGAIDIGDDGGPTDVPVVDLDSVELEESDDEDMSWE
jgi:putative nucleotidyltransferase with HDIG domain